MPRELPPPLTSKSSKRAMWDDIKAMSDEIEAQQRQILQLKSIAENVTKERDDALKQRKLERYQLQLIRAVMALTVNE